jgi:hypothetical protein
VSLGHGCNGWMPVVLSPTSTTFRDRDILARQGSSVDAGPTCGTFTQVLPAHLSSKHHNASYRAKSRMIDSLIIP